MFSQASFGRASPKKWYFWQCNIAEQAEIPIFPARTRELGRLSCTLQIWFSLGQHSFELLTFILFANFVIFVYRLLAASFCVPLHPSCRHCGWFQQARVYAPFFPLAPVFIFVWLSFWVVWAKSSFPMLPCNPLQPGRNFCSLVNCCGATVGSEQQHNQDFREIYKGRRILEFITFYHNALHLTTLFTTMHCI